MTGSELKDELLNKLGEIGSGFYDNTRLTMIVDRAKTNLVDQKISQFQANSKITADVQSLIIVGSPIAPTSGVILISALANYYRPINFSVTSPYRGSTNTAFATERKMGQFVSSYSVGDAEYPTYYFSADQLNIEPTDATSVTATYFRTPITIDVTDAAIQIPYNPDMINALLAQCLIEAGFDSRDPSATQAGVAQTQMNQ